MNTMLKSYVGLKTWNGGEMLAQIDEADGQYLARVSSGLVLARSSNRDDCIAQAGAMVQALGPIAPNALRIANWQRN